MRETNIPHDLAADPSARTDWSWYDLAAEEREKRRVFFIGFPIVAAAAFAIDVVTSPLIGRPYALPVMSAASGVVIILVFGVLSAWERLTLRHVARIVATAFTIALFVGIVGLLFSKLGIFSGNDLRSLSHRPQN